MPCHLQNYANDVDTNMDADVALFKKKCGPFIVGLFAVSPAQLAH